MTPSPTASLPTRRLRGLTVSALGLGAMSLSPGMYSDVGEDRARDALLAAVDAGVTHVDTSDGYGTNAHNERLIGRVLADHRDTVHVATKFGFQIPDGAPRHRVPIGYEFGFLEVNNDPALIRGYAEGSLRRLGREVIDLYYPHFPDPQVPLEETIGAVADLVRAGLVREIGLSNVDAQQLRRACGVHPISAVQTQWSLWEHPDPELRAAADELGVGIVAWSPLGAGFLAGTITDLVPGDFRTNISRYSRDNLAVNVDKYAPVRDLATELGRSPAQLALAWLLAQSPSVVPIPSSTNPAHIAENLRAVDEPLDAETCARIDAALADFDPAGSMRI